MTAKKSVQPSKLHFFFFSFCAIGVILLAPFLAGPLWFISFAEAMILLPAVIIYRNFVYERPVKNKVLAKRYCIGLFIYQSISAVFGTTTSLRLLEPGSGFGTKLAVIALSVGMVAALFGPFFVLAWDRFGTPPTKRSNEISET